MTNFFGLDKPQLRDLLTLRGDYSLIDEHPASPTLTIDSQVGNLVTFKAVGAGFDLYEFVLLDSGTGTAPWGSGVITQVSDTLAYTYVVVGSPVTRKAAVRGRDSTTKQFSDLSVWIDVSVT